MNNRKNIRLDKESYLGERAYSITACTNARKALLLRGEFYTDFVSILRETIGRDFDVYVYTVMPDHFHGLFVDKTEAANLGKSMKLFKQKTGFLYKKIFNEALWQRDYYDHVLRKEDSLEAVALYILYNPVEAGLSKNPFDYPYSGSFVYDDLRVLHP